MFIFLFIQVYPRQHEIIKRTMKPSPQGRKGCFITPDFPLLGIAELFSISKRDFSASEIILLYNANDQCCT